MDRVIVVCLIILAVLCVIVVTPFVVAPHFYSKKSPELPTNQYVAIYEEGYNKGVIINDTANASNVTWLAISALPQPFDYDRSWGFQDLTMNDSFKIVYGSITWYNNPGIFKSSEQIVNSVYEYPYTLKSGLTILNVYENGSIQAAYNNEPVLIEAGKNWTVRNVSQQIVAEPLTMKMGSDYPYSWVPYQTFAIRYNTSWTVKNLGIYKK